MTDQLTTEGLDANDPGDEAGATNVETAKLSRRQRRKQRVSKWDRPPDPHDWRFYVGNLGKILIATGVLLFGFVAYQLWGTGIEYAAAQNALESEFDQRLEAIGLDATADEVPNRPVDAPSALQPVGTPSEPVGNVNAPVLVPADNNGMVPVAVDLSDVAIEKPAPIVIPGEAFARLDIPRIHDDPMFVVPGVALTDLKKGPGHYNDTPLPGTLGNSAIAGHRTTYGAPFFDVDKLQSGDELIVTMADTGERFVYLVTYTQVVSASDYWVVTTSNPDVAELTLTSCHPKYTARDRIVVHSVLDPSRSSNVGVAAFYELDEPEVTATIPGDNPIVTVPPATTAAPATTIDAGVEESPMLGAPETTTPATTTPTTTSAAETTIPVVDAAPDAVEDAFSQGWFDDRDAWPQIALWGLALTIISLLAYQLSKKTRHDSIGFLVGILPFLFCLYFFFQNINRLLPPGL